MLFGTKNSLKLLINLERCKKDGPQQSVCCLFKLCLNSQMMIRVLKFTHIQYKIGLKKDNKNHYDFTFT